MDAIIDILEPSALVKAMASCCSDAVAIKDLNARYLFANPQYAELLGTEVEMLIGASDAEIATGNVTTATTCRVSLDEFHKLDKQALRNSVKDCPDPANDTGVDTSIAQTPPGVGQQWLNGRRGVAHRAEYPTADGRVKDIATLRIPITDKYDSVAGLLIHCTDLTGCTDLSAKLAEQTRDVQTAISTMRLKSDDTDLGRLETRNNLLSSLNAITVQLVNRTELAPLLRHIATELKRLLNADLVQINIAHESGHYLETACSAGKWLDSTKIRYRSGEGACGLAWKTRAVQCIDDYQCCHHNLAGMDDLQSCIAIPIFRDDEVIGTIDVAFSQRNTRFRDDVIDNPDVLDQLSQLMAVAIENATLHEATMATFAKTAALNELSKLIHRKSDLAEVLRQSSETVLDISDAMMVSIIEASSGRLCQDHTVYRQPCDKGNTPAITKGSLTPEPSKTLPESAAANRLIKPELATPGAADSAADNATDNATDNAAIWCFDNAQPVIVRQNEPCPFESATFIQWRQEYRVGPSLYIPLVHEQETYGVLVIHRSLDQPGFSEAELNLLHIAGNQISIAIYQSALLAKIRHDAYHDGLTQLPNRSFFEKQLAKAIANARYAATRFAVLFMDLDGFKSVNDTLGHGVGDKLLRCVSDRLAANIREGDLLVRLGGDEFAVLLHELADQATAVAIAARLNQSLQSTVEIDGYKITISVSIGLSFYPADGYTADELLKNADIAMYQAKNSGKNRINCFDEQMALKYQERVRLETDLKEAVLNDQIYVVYQPQIEPHSGRVVAVEALARWKHPTLGHIPPDKFIPVAEESGLITQIGERVLRDACKQTRAWQQAGYQRMQVAVNISAQQFTQDDFENVVFDALQCSGLKPGFLELEITENIVMENVSRVVSKLNTLRASGIQIAIDDFGTGYSSLRYLQDLPLDTLKIDRSFVTTLDHDDPHHSLVNTIILMASSFGMTTVAEGVETRQQLQSVIELGCDYIQGYYYSKPVEASGLPSVADRINSAPIELAAAA